MSNFPLCSRVLAAALAMACGTVSAQHIPVYPPALRGAIGGHWYNPEQNGHGVHVEILDGGRAVVSWYTFASDGRPLWVIGDGKHHSTVVEARLYEVHGGSPPLTWPAGSVGIDPVEWGTVSIDFSGCDAGTLSWDSIDPAFGRGAMPISRLTRVEGLRCNAEEDFGLQLAYNFERSDMDFEAVFADFPVGKKTEWEIGESWTELPDPLYSRKGIRLAGVNHSDDLAMLIKKPIGGLRPNTRYRVELDVELASNVPFDCIGVGGAPGEGVTVKLGASTIEPVADQVIEGGTAMWRLNIDYGQQQQGGSDARNVGHIAVHGQLPFYRWSDAEGRLWVFAGVDSGFEGRSEVYFSTLRVRLDPRDDSAGDAP
jgi:hypothetical protein